MCAMQNNFYCIRLHTTFTGDGYLASCIATVILKEKPAQDKISRNVLLLASRKRHPSVGRYLPFNAGRWNSCAPELVLFSVIIKDNAAALQTCPRLIMNSTGIEL